MKLINTSIKNLQNDVILKVNNKILFTEYIIVLIFEMYKLNINRKRTNCKDLMFVFNLHFNLIKKQFFI